MRSKKVPVYGPEKIAVSCSINGSARVLGFEGKDSWKDQDGVNFEDNVKYVRADTTPGEMAEALHLVMRAVSERLGTGYYHELLARLPKVIERLVAEAPRPHDGS